MSKVLLAGSKGRRLQFDNDGKLSLSTFGVYFIENMLTSLAFSSNSKIISIEASTNQPNETLLSTTMTPSNVVDP